MDFKIRNIIGAAVFMLAIAAACQKPEDVLPGGDEPASGISNIVNSNGEKKVSQFGGTVRVKFDASQAWTASLTLKTSPDSKWASINDKTLSGPAKDGNEVRVSVKQNNGNEERIAELWITLEGFEPELVATLTQVASGVSTDSEMNKALNTYMNDILKEEYLWADAYNEQDINLDIDYRDFLKTHLLSLGDVNVEDGGYYKTLQANAGQRYIYTNISEVYLVSGQSTKAGNEPEYTYGLGFGPFLSSSLPDNPGMMALAPSFVRQGSPAAAAGLRRGDMIYAVNGVALTTGNYQTYMSSLYMNPSGSYEFSFYRFEDDGEGGYDMNPYTSGTATAEAYIYNPVLYFAILNDPDNSSNKIGYLVYEAFELTGQKFLEDAVDQFVTEGITDLILDLRFNVGGAVSQSRWLSGCIAGDSNGKKTFVNVIFGNGKTENWKFDYGYSNDTDNLGKPKDLGLDRLFVIGSYNTASASELVINSLRGIDFPVKLIGTTTEGKNVGMTVSQTTYRDRAFQFAPTTFYVKNAKGFGDYPDGFVPDENVNNENSSFDDDDDNVFPYSFADWGNMDYNIALQWAYCDITGRDRWSRDPDTKSAASVKPVPVDMQPMELIPGRYGNLIYEY